MNMRSASTLLPAALMALVLNHAGAATLLTFDFDDIASSSISTLQYQTGNRLVYNASFTDWARGGFNATHAIQLSGAVHGAAGDYAIMIYGNNTLVQQTAFAANDLGVTYYVSYDLGPTVYSEPTQATQAGDTFRVSLLRGDDSVLATNDVAVGAWAGVQTFEQEYFSYVGDGTGPVRIKLASGNTQTRFAGAIDNVSFWDTVPTSASAIPEPSVPMGCGLLLGSAFLLRRRGGRP